MATEIERKFLLCSDAWRDQVSRSTEIRQGYLCEPKTASVRVRLSGEKANLNIKSTTLGISRLEYEYPIPLDEAREMLDKLCGGKTVDKTRYEVKIGNHVWEIDEFVGRNAGLIVAEVELSAEDEAFEKPDWAGEEVSDDVRYYNVNLLENPYCDW